MSFFLVLLFGFKQIGHWSLQTNWSSCEMKLCSMSVCWDVLLAKICFALNFLFQLPSLVLLSCVDECLKKLIGIGESSMAQLQEPWATNLRIVISRLLRTRNLGWSS